MQLVKHIFTGGLLLLSWVGLAQYSGQGPVTMSAPAGATNIQWFQYTSGGSTALSGETGSTYASSTAGVYSPRYTVAGQPNCTDDQTVYTIIANEGEAVTLNGSTNNSGATAYQWNNDGVAISGANTANLTVTAGGLYSLSITKGACTVESEKYFIYMLENPSPDLFPNFTFGNTSYGVNDERSVIINVNEILGINTNNDPIQLFVPNVSGFQLVFDNTANSVTVFGAETVNNTQWTAVDNGIGLLFTSSSMIPMSGRSRIGVKLKALTSGTAANLTVNLIQGSGGENNSLNNVGVLAISSQN